MRRFSKNKDINAFIRQLIKSKQWYCVQGGKHCSLFSPAGKRITIPSTPSDYRAYKNFKKDIERIIYHEVS
ncbi:hypothetical protein J4H69_20265 [Vibrio alginolyticus]|uniref:hypothetical protein n=1 Tax=Vibrio alginolyticus TaxID=663 RepID=UPI001BD1EF84|nr:hypothetical protein [Vibrio alginolyticus]MBT0068284.1 hypothetical protein [Vibrio alginolyticus]